MQKTSLNQLSSFPLCFCFQIQYKIKGNQSRSSSPIECGSLPNKNSNMLLIIIVKFGQYTFIMIGPRSADRKKVFEYSKNYSRDMNQQSAAMIGKPQDHTQSNLNANYNQLRELFKDRKSLLQKKTENLIKNHQNKLSIIKNARESDLKNEARNLGDRDIMNLLDNQSENQNCRVLLQKIAGISNINNYDGTERQTGKAFWDSHKQFQRDMKKKAQIYANQSRQLKGINQRERSIFLEIERLENQMISILTKARKDPDHIKKAQKFNQEIEKKKQYLKETKGEKQKLKRTIQDTISNILEFNDRNQVHSKKRLREVSDIFGGNQSLADFDEFLDSLQFIVEKKGEDTKSQEVYANAIRKLINDYDLLYEQLQKFHEEEQSIFGKINQLFRENTKHAFLQKIYLAGISNKQDQYDLLKKCQSYRRLLSDLDQDRPLIRESLNKISQMNNMLIPIQKAYSTQDTRKQQLKRQIKRLSQLHGDLETRGKNLRNFAFKMQQLMRTREETEAELNDCAEKGNLDEYKKKVNNLGEIDKQIEIQRENANTTEIKRQQELLIEELEKVNLKYEDIIEEIIVQEQKMYFGTYLNKLEKRLSLV